MTPEPFRRVSCALAFLILVPAILSCAPKQPPAEPTSTQPASLEPAQPAEPTAPVEDVEDTWKTPVEPAVQEEKLPPRTLASRAEEYNRQGVLQTVYFAFDKSELKDKARRTLTNNASWLRSNPEFDLLIAGHCDERGTEEYNLALGERRASVVRSYLISLRIPAHRLTTISYGEERPANPAHNEAAWSKNRRGQFVVQAP